MRPGKRAARDLCDVPAEHRRVLRRIQAGDIGGLGREVWIVRSQVVFESMRLDAVFAQRPVTVLCESIGRQQHQTGVSS